MALEMTGSLRAAKPGRSVSGDKAHELREQAPSISPSRAMPREVVKWMARVQDVQKPLGALNDLETGLVHARAALVRALATGQAEEAARAGFELAWLLPVRNDALARMRRRVKRLKR